MDNGTSFVPETMLTSSKYAEATTKSAATGKGGGIKSIPTQKKAAPSQPEERALNLQNPGYRGVRRRNCGKWASEICEPKKKIRRLLRHARDGCSSARCRFIPLKGNNCALLNFPELIDHLPCPISLSPCEFQATAAEAAVAFHSECGGNSGRSNDEYKGGRRSSKKDGECNESAATSSSTLSFLESDGHGRG